MQRNKHFQSVSERYIFREIEQRKHDFLQKNPSAKLVSLSVGDTTEPIVPTGAIGLKNAAAALGTYEGYTGYGPEEGIKTLRQAIGNVIYQSTLDASEIFISDGAACDIGRLQILFGPDVQIAVQDPAYPAYLDTTLLCRGEKPILLPCTPENDFFPDLQKAKDADILFLCSPNNPTGTIFTKEQLTDLVQFAIQHNKIIVFDAAYMAFVRSPHPQSIYEIEGAKKVAIEIGSFSKMAGFTGVRLGWTVVPHELAYDDGKKIHPDWMRIVTTFFNGPSIISQKGALQILQDGMHEIEHQVSHYLHNAALLRAVFEKNGIVYGGIHSPYLWVHMNGKTSWQAFHDLLETYHIITMPGVGFGPTGDGFLRLSAFAKREHIQEACRRINNSYF